MSATLHVTSPRRGSRQRGISLRRRSSNPMAASCNAPAISRAAAIGIARSAASQPLAIGMTSAPPIMQILKISGNAAATMNLPCAFASAAQKAASEISGR